MRAIFRRALRDTVAQSGGLSGIALLIAGPILSYFFVRPLFGDDAMSGAWPGVVSGFAGLGAAVLLLFLWNLFSAPHRMEKEKRETLECRVSELEDKISQGARLVIEPQQKYFGGKFPDGKTHLTILLMVKNKGSLPSAAIAWRVKLLISGNEDIIRPSLIKGTLSLSLQDEGVPDVTFHEADMIVEKTYLPIPAGGVVSGYFFGVVRGDMFDEITDTDRISIECEQVDGTVVLAEDTFRGKPARPITLPGMMRG